MDHRASFALLIAVAMLPACTKDVQEDPVADNALFALDLPAGWPQPPVPENNPLTNASVQLGKALFFDERLSLDRGISCASCHHPGSAFSDSLPFSLGVHGEAGFRNAPSLANVGYHPLLFRDGGVPTLEQQVLVPLLDEKEMDANPQAVIELLQADAQLTAMSKRAYGKPLDQLVLTQAIANYERTLISGHSRYDRYLQGDASALSEAATRGLQLFTGSAHCSVCHSGPDLSDHDFHNVGTAGDGTADAGRERITFLSQDRGKFKTPTLRNISRTAPYMHHGGMATLEAVVHHFNTPPPEAGMQSLGLSASEEQDLVAFLRALDNERPLDQVP